MPKRIPLAAMQVTTLPRVSRAAAAMVDLAAPIASGRKKISFTAMNAKARSSRSEPPQAAMWGASAFISRAEAAFWRLCPSSPMCRAWTRIAARSTPPERRTAAPSSSANSPSIQARRARVSRSLAP